MVHDLDIRWAFRYHLRVPDIILEETFGSATDFIDALCPRNSRWRGRPFSWVFRGHQDANWVLVPPALRDRGVFLGVGPRAPEGRRPTELEQLKCEHELLTEFLFYVDKSGLQIPDGFAYTPEARREEYRLEESVIAGGQYWPPTKWLPWVALAQHYHIPTRLLDWSASAKVACLFAVKDVKQGGQGKLCVWALDIEWLDAAWRGVFGDTPAKSCGVMAELYDNTLVRVVRAPRSSNPRLHAQHGLFTVVQRCNLTASSEPDTRPLDEVIRGRSGQFQHPFQTLPDAPPILFKLCIDVGHAPELMRLLYMEGIDPASIFPGFEGAAQAVLGTRSLDRLF